MPIYAYRCQSCGFAKDVLQKISDPVLVECPECHQSTFSKQLTAAGFHLKGTGWYVTDHKNPQQKPAAASTSGSSGGSGSSASASDSGSSGSSTSASTDSSASASPASSSSEKAA